MTAAKHFAVAEILSRTGILSRTLCLAGIATVVGCQNSVEFSPPPPPEVGCTLPVQKEVTEYLEFSGMTQPVETVEIRARVKGFLKERHFEEGAEVKAGQLLLVIDEEPFQIQLEAATSRLEEAKSVLKQAEVSKSREVAAAQVNQIESQLLLSQQEEGRIQGLREQRVSTAADLDQATATRKVRAAELESAKANLEQALATYETTILAARAQVASAEIAVRNARLDLGYCRMWSPIDGRISRIHVDIGNLVGDGQSLVLATIVKAHPVYAYATISELDFLNTRSLLQLRNRTSEKSDSAAGSAKAPVVPVELGLANQTDFPYAGVLDYLDPSLDSATGTLRIRGQFANDDGSLLPGMFVRMRIPVQKRSDVLLVPERALGMGQSGQYVLVVDDEDIARDRPVKVGVSVGKLRVVEGDFTATDRVIVEGLLRARPGSKVTPVMLPVKADVTASSSVSGKR